MLAHNKRYMVMLEVWNAKDIKNVTPSISMDQYDTIGEVNAAVDLIIGMYMNVRSPVKWDGSSHYWGYAILDFQDEKILSVGHDGLQSYMGMKDDTYKLLKMADDFFRKDGEIPSDYQWADGEYAGWLQFRWGDKKNAVTYSKAGNKIKPNHNNIMFGTAKSIYGTNVKMKSNMPKKNLANIITED